MAHSKLKEQIFQLEKRLMNRHYCDLDALLAEDYLEFGSSGNTYDKMTQLGRSNTSGDLSYTVTNFNIRLLTPQVILATYQTHKTEDKKRAWRSSIWKRNEDKWQMVFHQGTPIT